MHESEIGAVPESRPAAVVPTGKYEAHVTFDVQHAETIKEWEGLFGLEWKYSAFDADPIMGAKPFCYLTGYATNERELLYLMRHLTQEILRRHNIVALREKIERIIFDTKTGVNEIGA